MSRSLHANARGASIVITFLGALVNLVLAVQVLAAWGTIKWEQESEWEGMDDTWRVIGTRLAWGLLSVYFAAATVVCSVGLVGIIRNKLSFIRFYRDYSTIDFTFSALLTVAGTYGAFRTSLGAQLCEELSRQPEFMRDMNDVGLSLENCELWFERVVLVSVGVMVILLVIRLHFLMAVSNYYSHILRRNVLPMYSSARSRENADTLQRIYLLPRQQQPPQPGPSTPYSPSSLLKTTPEDDVLVYAPVPLSSLSPEAVRELHSTATEAWISKIGSGHRDATPEQDCSHASALRTHRHRRRESHSAGSSAGRICLPVRPEEGLLPEYPDYDLKPINHKD